METANRGLLLALAFVLSILGYDRARRAVAPVPEPVRRAATAAQGDRLVLRRELGKYLPGGIWPVVGRGELATRGGVSRTVAYASTLISLGVMCIGAALTCGLLSPIVEIQAGSRLAPNSCCCSSRVPLGIIAVHPAHLRPVPEVLTKATKGRFDARAGRRGAGCSGLSWSRSPAGWQSARPPLWSLRRSASTQAARVAFAAIAAWIIGFLAVPVPAGAGIRELVFVWLSGLPGAEATAVAAVARVMLILVDGLAGVIGLLCIRRMFISAESIKDEPIEVSSSNFEEREGWK